MNTSAIFVSVVILLAFALFGRMIELDHQFKMETLKRTPPATMPAPECQRMPSPLT